MMLRFRGIFARRFYHGAYAGSRFAPRTWRRVVQVNVLAIGGAVAGYAAFYAPPLRLDAPPSATVPSGTSVEAFPRRLSLQDGVHVFLGLGIRTVSFLRVQVYVLGIYLDEADLPRVSSLLHQYPDLSEKLADPSTDLYDQIMDLGVGLVIRIVPVRNTDFAHLRDGFVRGIRSKEIAHDESFEQALDSFKQIFSGRGSCPKNATLLLRRDRSGALEVTYDGLVIGHVGDPRISRAIVMNYVRGKTVASEAARQQVNAGLVQLSHDWKSL